MVFPSRARRLRKALGGGMRQVGILAAAGLYALDEIVPKLGEDHYKTYKIAEGKSHSSALPFLLEQTFIRFRAACCPFHAMFSIEEGM